MPDMTITCVDCGSDFSFSERDQAFFAERGMSTPKRCRECKNEICLETEYESGASWLRRVGIRIGVN